MEQQIKCPKCGSTQLSANKKGFSGKQAVAGAILTGGIGLLAGTIGSNKIKITCLSCGHTFNVGGDKASLEKKKEDAKQNQGPFLIVILIIAVSFFVFKACNSDPKPNKNNDNSSNIAVPQNPNIQEKDLPKYEVIHQNNSEDGYNYDIFLTDTARIEILNDYLSYKYNSDGKHWIKINYFNNKEVSKIYFDRILKPNISDKESDYLFKFYIAGYIDNPATGEIRLTWLHR